MAWPTGQEYSESVQNPQQAFEDAELRVGCVEIDRVGLPRARSGNFAVVYKLACGQRNWAVKCFTREVPGQQARYAEISTHLLRQQLPCIVGFEYLARG